MTKDCAIAIATTAAEELRGAIVSGCAIVLMFAATWMPF